MPPISLRHSPNVYFVKQSHPSQVFFPSTLAVHRDDVDDINDETNNPEMFKCHWNCYVLTQIIIIWRSFFFSIQTVIASFP